MILEEQVFNPTSFVLFLHAALAIIIVYQFDQETKKGLDSMGQQIQELSAIICEEAKRVEERCSGKYNKARLLPM